MRNGNRTRRDIVSTRLLMSDTKDPRDQTPKTDTTDDPPGTFSDLTPSFPFRFYKEEERYGGRRNDRPGLVGDTVVESDQSRKRQDHRGGSRDPRSLWRRETWRTDSLRGRSASTIKDPTVG